MNTAGTEIGTLLWALGILISVNIVLLGFIGSRLWTHVVECRGMGERVAALDKDVERMKCDIGTHDTGLRGEVHRTATMSTQHELRLTNLERQ